MNEWIECSQQPCKGKEHHLHLQIRKPRLRERKWLIPAHMAHPVGRTRIGIQVDWAPKFSILPPIGSILPVHGSDNMCWVPQVNMSWYRVQRWHVKEREGLLWLNWEAPWKSAQRASATSDECPINRSVQEPAWKLTFAKLLLCAWPILFLVAVQFCKVRCHSSPFYGGQWGTERLKHLTQFTQVGSGKNGFRRPWSVLFLIPHSPFLWTTFPLIWGL